MLTVDHYGQIRRAHRDGMSIRDIARTFHHSRRKIRQILQQPQPQPYTRSKPAPAPVLGSFHAVIDAILTADEDAPPKQRHTAMQVYRRLRTEHDYGGGYDQVRRYVGRHRRDRRETFIPLAHDPGQRLEADFGHIHVDFPDGRRLVPVLIAAWSFSDYGFALATPTERTEAILAGMVEAFAFFGCVPYEVWWDNPRTVVAQIFQGRDRRPNPYYAALASHYAFEPLFCMPARGNEKPCAETRVRVLQRQWASPQTPGIFGGMNSGVRWGEEPPKARGLRGPAGVIGPPSAGLSLGGLRPRRAHLRFTRR
jgi:transposase